MVLQRVPDDPNQWNSSTPADLDDIRRESTAIDNLATWQGGMANIVGAGGEPERVLQTLVSANFFDTLGVQPVYGRGFQEGEDQPGREREVVLSDRLWRRRFAADPAIVGKNIRLDDQNFLVTGVMPASFDFPMATELWTPHAFTPAQLANRRGNQVEAAARLSPGRTLEQAGAELDRISARLEKSYPDTNKGRRYMVWPARRFMVDSETQQYLDHAAWLGDLRAADRLRQRGQPAVRPRHRPPARSRRAYRAGRIALARDRTTGHRKRAALRGRRALRPADRQMGNRHDARRHAPGNRTLHPRLEGHSDGCPHPAVHPDRRRS